MSTASALRKTFDCLESSCIAASPRTKFMDICNAHDRACAAIIEENKRLKAQLAGRQ